MDQNPPPQLLAKLDELETLVRERLAKTSHLLNTPSEGLDGGATQREPTSTGVQSGAGSPRLGLTSGLEPTGARDRLGESTFVGAKIDISRQSTESIFARISRFFGAMR